MSAVLLDLPDDSLVRIFTYLTNSASPAVLSSRAYRDGAGFPLAATCRRLHALFTTTLLTALSAAIDAAAPRVPSSSTSSFHIAALIRAAGSALTSLTLATHPPARSTFHKCYAPIFQRAGDRDPFAVDFDPAGLLATARGHAIRLRELRVVHRKVSYLHDDSIAELELLLRERRQELVQFEHVHVDLKAARAIASALAPRLDGVATMPLLRELRLPRYTGHWSSLTRILMQAGPTLETLEISGDLSGTTVSQHLGNFAVDYLDDPVPGPGPGGDAIGAAIMALAPAAMAAAAAAGAAAAAANVEPSSAIRNEPRPTQAEVALVASCCASLTELHVGKMDPLLAPLGLALVDACSRLRTLTLYEVSGNLIPGRCYVMALLQKAEEKCPDLGAIHIVSCELVGDARDLFVAVGTRLRSFSGPFFWESSGELEMFASVCPNVEVLALRCGGRGENACGEGAVAACTTFGRSLKSLFISNENVSADSFLTAIAAATSIEELEIECHPRLSPADFARILPVIGANLRVITVECQATGYGVSGTGTNDTKLLNVIGDHCPKLELLHLPQLYVNCSLTADACLEAHAVLSALEVRLPYLNTSTSPLNIPSL
jgi:hypothetical protein